MQVSFDDSSGSRGDEVIVAVHSAGEAATSATFSRRNDGPAP
jgi:hypothetical protein